MSKFFSFLAGAMCGAIVGSVAALLLTPASGSELRSEVNARLEEAMREGRRAKQEMEQALNSEFERMKQGHN
ncbi:MAG: YtxH domain-containing protein [Anaerolineae bacterium]|nr:YtxH domain-containing protein [Anaerolineae bacterium]